MRNFILYVFVTFSLMCGFAIAAKDCNCDKNFTYNKGDQCKHGSITKTCESDTCAGNIMCGPLSPNGRTAISGSSGTGKPKN